MAYLEFDGEWNSRSVWVCGDQYFATAPEQLAEAERNLGGRLLGDQPLSKMDLTRAKGVKEISADQFEDIWMRAVQT